MHNYSRKNNFEHDFTSHECHTIIPYSNTLGTRADLGVDSREHRGEMFKDRTEVAVGVWLRSGLILTTLQSFHELSIGYSSIGAVG